MSGPDQPRGEGAGDRDRDSWPAGEPARRPVAGGQLVDNNFNLFLYEDPAGGRLQNGQTDVSSGGLARWWSFGP